MIQSIGQCEQTTQVPIATTAVSTAHGAFSSLTYFILINGIYFASLTVAFKELLWHIFATSQHVDAIQSERRLFSED